ncbi:hypothetical protein HZS_7228 [Henneguya salminicola]|nr:hypothetical protein HZS_7228 [Henneguya salminicola]
MCRRVWGNAEITCETAIRDFERASINSFMFCNPSTSLTICFSPLVNVYGVAIMAAGQSTLYRDNEIARSIFNMFAAIAFIQEDNVILTPNPCKKKCVIMDTFVGVHHLTGRSQPLFLIRLWNKCERTEKGSSQANNKVECWKNAFASLVDRNPLNI